VTVTDNQTPKVLDIAIGLDATGMRREFDSLGQVEVPADRYWGAQTQRSLEHFNIGHDRMPTEVYHAYGYVKKAAAVVNTAAGRLPVWKGQLIQQVCDEVISGHLDSEFPLYVWQTGSGTQSNMNVNEVISNRCIQLVGGTLGSQEPVHPNDHVNMAQSSNDTFPTAMHIAAYTMATGRTIPALKRLRDAIDAKSNQWAGVVKIGRTHLEDATPLTVGQEWSGYAGALDDAIAEVEHATAGLLVLAMGGTAVGTGLNAPPRFGEQVATQIAQMTGAPYRTATNKFTAQGTLDRMVRAHAGLKAVAVSLFKIANDLRWLGIWLGTGDQGWMANTRRPDRELLSFTDDVAQDHLAGKVHVGLYPLLRDDTCRLLVCDFDGAGWTLDALAFLDAARCAAIPAALERSRSGEGGHVWIFFGERVPASTVRRLPTPNGPGNANGHATAGASLPPPTNKSPPVRRGTDESD